MGPADAKSPTTWAIVFNLSRSGFSTQAGDSLPRAKLTEGGQPSKHIDRASTPREPSEIFKLEGGNVAGRAPLCLTLISSCTANSRKPKGSECSFDQPGVSCRKFHALCSPRRASSGTLPGRVGSSLTAGLFRSYRQPLVPRRGSVSLIVSFFPKSIPPKNKSVPVKPRTNRKILRLRRIAECHVGDRGELPPRRQPSLETDASRVCLSPRGLSLSMLLSL